MLLIQVPMRKYLSKVSQDMRDKGHSDSLKHFVMVENKIFEDT